MSHAVTIEVGVVVAREKIDHPWQDYRWRGERVPRRSREGRLARAASGTGLHPSRGDAPARSASQGDDRLPRQLANGVPSVYVVLREDPTASDPVQVHLVSASPFEVQAYGESGMETVERVAMPERLVALVQAFVEEHHVEEPFVKRQRQRFADEGEQFGQEPIFVLRERLQAGARRAAAAAATSTSDDAIRRGRDAMSDRDGELPHPLGTAEAESGEARPTPEAHGRRDARPDGVEERLRTRLRHPTARAIVLPSRGPPCRAR